MLLRMDRDLLREERMTKPESQNTGMETIQPMRLMAMPGRFLPTVRSTLSAIVRAAPLLSSMAPMIVPSRITTPMPRQVTLNPSRIVLSTSKGGMPTASPIRSAAANSETKGCSLSFDTIKTMMRMVSNRMTISAEPWSKRPITFL